MKGGLDWVGRGVLTYYRLFVAGGAGAGAVRRFFSWFLAASSALVL